MISRVNDGANMLEKGNRQLKMSKKGQNRPHLQ